MSCQTLLSTWPVLHCQGTFIISQAILASKVMLHLQSSSIKIITCTSSVTKNSVIYNQTRDNYITSRLIQISIIVIIPYIDVRAGHNYLEK